MPNFVKSTDPHSYYKEGQPKIVHMQWNAVVNFPQQKVGGSVIITFDGSGHVDLDSRKLDIISVSNTETTASIPFTVGEHEPILGSKFSFDVPESLMVKVLYGASPEASGLKWLTPEQTGGKKHPFMFSQGQAIHARSYIPCQDTALVRFTFEAKLTVPVALRGLIAACEHVGRTEDNELAYEEYKMTLPIPSYLLGFAVGDLESRELSERSRVWAEPHLIEKAAAEFVDVPKMVATAEQVFKKPYPWGRFDMLIMPASFPYGGMENPCLAFLTPALVVGDKSQVFVVAHELAHAWTGNLVTNARQEDFWLNEGWTVYAEQRIMEAIYGSDAALLSRALLAREFERDVKRLMKTNPQITALVSDLTGIDPDDVFSRMPYYKGSMYLVTLEQRVGRDAYDRMMGKYIETFAFQSITTQQFLDFLADQFPGIHERLRTKEWIYGTGGLPDNAPQVSSRMVDEVTGYAKQGDVPHESIGRCWNSSQWELYCELLPRPFSIANLHVLNRYFSLGKSPNMDTRCAYLLLAIESGDVGAYDNVQDFLLTQGRMKYLNPLYAALAKTPNGISFAQHVYARAHGGYHPIAISQVERVFEEAKAA